MKKRLLAIALLACALIVGIAPAAAFAEDKTTITNVALTIDNPAPGVTVASDLGLKISTTPTSNAKLIDWIMAKCPEDVYDPSIEPTDLEWTQIYSGVTYEAGYWYGIGVQLFAGAGAEFSDSVTVTINGNSPNRQYVDIQGYLIVYYFFHVTDHTHVYNAAIWSSDATQHWHECTDADCPDKTGSIKDVAAHTFQWVVDREATTTEVGIKHEACTVCGYTRNENTEIAKLDPATLIPKTGDATNVALPVGVVLVGGAVVAAAIYLRKKHSGK